MTPERWRQVTEIFHAALARDTPERAAFLDAACAGDRALRDEVNAMLAAHHAPGTITDRPVSGSIDDAPRLGTGAMVGSYRIDKLIGAGGMGEVYKARDTKLGRNVAVKVLPAAFTSDSERLARFEREARLLAALNHPHIAAIYGLEEAQDVRALILELVEGETLADQLRHGPIPLDQTLPIARHIADALEAAHEHGVIHRDLKPANIKITPEGTVKVLDFGLAKAFVGDGSNPDMSRLPTVTVERTREGIIAGTPAYMSPEQARGQAVSKRTDIWAFGCVLYEMLTGKRAFGGEDVSETLAHIIDREPDFSALPKKTPAPIVKLLQRCLEKDPKRRVPDMAVARFEMDEALTVPAAATVLPPVRPLRLWQRPLPLAAAIVMVTIVTGLAVWTLRRPSPPQVVRWTMTPSGATALTFAGGGGSSLAISPDGTRLVYVGANGTLLLRALDQLAPTPLGGLDEPRAPVFSPDGQWIGFFNGNEALMKVATAGGPPVTVIPIIGTAAGANWGADDTILFATTDPSTGLLRVPAGGGESEVLTRPNRDRGEVDHLYPEVLPGGHAVLFTITTAGAIETARIAVLDLTTREQRILVHGGSHAHYVPTGHLVYGVAGTLRAVGFDLNRLAVLGTSVPVLDQVRTIGDVPNMSTSGSGTLVYATGGQPAPFGPSGNTLVWVDRQGREDPLEAPPLPYRYPRLSPDGARVAVEAVVDIWMWDLTRKTLTRFTFNPGQDQYPVWTPDGRRLLFRSERSGPHNIFWQAADGTGGVERLTESPNEQAPYSVSPDGTRLVFREDVRATGQDLKMLMLQGEQRAEPLVQTAFNERNGEISPDGRWLAYQSNESGQHEIYVRPFPDVNSGRWQISTGGGRTPLWARSGKELFYRAPDGTVLGATVEAADGPNFRVGTPARLFVGGYLVGGGTTSPGRTYDVSRDGQRFLMVKPRASTTATAVPPEIIVVQNWTEELKRLVPTR